MSLSSRLIKASSRLASRTLPLHGNPALSRALAVSARPRPAQASPYRKRPVSINPRAEARGRPPAPKKNARGSRRPARPAPPRTHVLPDAGLSAQQLAALAGVSEARVLVCARELDESVLDASSPLPPALVELAAEALSLNVLFRSQTEPLLTRGAPGGKVRVPRMPVVTVMGHVDHGKTSLLDALRGGDVAKREVGGITQSVAAFQVPIKAATGGADGGEGKEKQFATFIDTPGHAAFKAMRANGTVGTDIVVLVVAADDGVMPQSIEAGKLARAANVPVIVAVNKCDAPGADPERVRYQLLETLGLNTEQLGGDVQCVDISAKTGANLPQLLEAVSLQAEMLDLQSDPQARATGICLESRVDRSLGSIATVIVRAGTLKPGDYMVFQSPQALRGDLFGRVRGLMGRDSQHLREARPGVAVGVIGVREPIPPGAEFLVEANEKAARARSHEMIVRNVQAVETIELANSICAEREANSKAVSDLSKGPVPVSRNEAAEKSKSATLPEDAIDDDAKVRSIVVLIKGDVKGSADAVAQCVEAFGTPRYPVRIINVGVGDVTDMDIKVASATRKAKGNIDESMIIAFNVRVKDAEMRNARRAGVRVLSHNLIYHLEDELKETLGKIHDEHKTVEESLGKAAVVRVFDDGKIAGCSVQDGVLSQGDLAKVWRFPDSKAGHGDREVVFSGNVDSIKHFAKAVRSVKKGSECGIGLGGWSGFIAGDVVECIKNRKLNEDV